MEGGGLYVEVEELFQGEGGQVGLGVVGEGGEWEEKREGAEGDDGGLTFG